MEGADQLVLVLVRVVAVVGAAAVAQDVAAIAGDVDQGVDVGV